MFRSRCPVVFIPRVLTSLPGKAFPLECPRPTAQEDAAEEAELAEAREWLEMDEAARRKWQPLVVHPSECTRIPEWHAEKAEQGFHEEPEGMLTEV